MANITHTLRGPLFHPTFPTRIRCGNNIRFKGSRAWESGTKGPQGVRLHRAAAGRMGHMRVQGVCAQTSVPL